LGGGDLVFDAVEGDCVCVAVINGVGGAGVAVPGLADTAWVEDDALVAVESNRVVVVKAVELAAFGRLRVFADEHWDVGVADETEGGLLEVEVGEGGFGVVEVFPDGPAEGAVDEGKVVAALDFGKRIEEGAFVRVQACLRPLRGGGGVRVEVFGADSAGGSALVVARYHRRAEVFQARDALGGLGAVADAVAKGPDGVNGAAALGVVEDGLEGDEICVDVGDDEGAHGGSIANGRSYNVAVNVSELGEFGLIARLASVIGAETPADLIVGIGDDAAAWRAGEQVLLATTDTLVEGVHFLPEFAAWADVGWKALAVNVSDVSAMGGEPLFALVTLALPLETEVSVADELYGGLMECSREYGVTVAGGDIVRASQMSLTIALIGRAQMREGEPLLMRRDGAKAGDVIAVTGTLGDSAAGLWRLRKGATEEDALVRAHLRPLPRLADAQEAARIGVVCAVDVSDGLMQDLGHICERSGLGAKIREELLPLSEDLRAAYPEDVLALACSGGEDYELLITGHEETVGQVGEQISAALTVIGRIVESTEHRPRLLDGAGNELAVAVHGWDNLHSG
jgi:thiamine-monophosphate kinase